MLTLEHKQEVYLKDVKKTSLCALGLPSLSISAFSVRALHPYF